LGIFGQKVLEEGVVFQMFKKEALESKKEAAVAQRIELIRTRSISDLDQFFRSIGDNGSFFNLNSNILFRKK